MAVHTIIGVDPGIVHTGVVMFKFDTITMGFRKEFKVIDGADAPEVSGWVRARNQGGNAIVSIEKYDDRGPAFKQHGVMRAVETELRRLLPEATLLSNTGIKKVVTEALMRLLDVWNFTEKTHHQDLRSAARIGLLGGFKDPLTNEALAALVTHLLREEGVL